MQPFSLLFCKLTSKPLRSHLWMAGASLMPGKGDTEDCDIDNDVVGVD